jgi:predicted heme/steroid binding protein
MNQFNLEKWLFRVNRIAAWVLMLAVLVHLLLSYGLIRDFFKLPNSWLSAIIIISLFLHIGLSLRSVLVARKIWRGVVKFLIVLVCLALLFFFLYLEFRSPCYRKTPESSYYPESEFLLELSGPEEDSEIDLIVEESPLKEDPSVENALRVFTLQELSYHDGRDGRPAYVAVDGLVYDNTDIFREGRHYSHLAGQELTDEFYSYHVIEEMMKYPVVGRLAE